MKKLSAKELKEYWINFFEENGHLYIESKSLIPINDPSLLWINSGVATLKKYFSGIENPPSNRLVNIQKAVRTNDIENVGKTARHHTFFEMMGNFSIGDYFKKEAIQFAYDFLINKLEIDKNLLYITVYKEDDEAYNEWIKVGIDSSHIFKEGKDRNFWDVGNGPCGPNTEIYFDRGEKYDFNHEGIKLLEDDIENDRYIEIWNIVFSQFNNNGKNQYEELKRKNIDTGAGYERFLSILQETPTNYETDLFLPLINDLEKFTNVKYEINAFFTKDQRQLEDNRCFKVIVDHIKSAVFMVADGALPSNKDRGYVLRRLIRRAIVCANKLNLKNGWLDSLINKITEVMGEFYPYLFNLKSKILLVISTEQKQFNKTLKTGLKIFEEAYENNKIDANLVFDLEQTYGFPTSLVDEMCEERNISYDKKEYKKLYEEHQRISKSNELGKIKALVQQNKNLLELKVQSEFFYDKNYISNAKVIALFDDEFNVLETLSGSGWVVLDKTCLYATGGGQLHDEGWIDNFEVDNVIKGPNLQHLQHVNSAYLELNQIVNVKYNEITRSLLRCNHTGVHLIQAMLKENISETIKQAGAFKSKEKWSFDFTYDKKLTNDQIQLIESKVNEVIQEAIPVEVIHTDLQEAEKMHAIMEFGDMYSKQKVLRLIKIGDVSLELCGGTHAKNTSELEILKITGFYSLGSGVWRIEGFTRYLNYYKNTNNYLNNLVSIHKNSLVQMIKDNKLNLLEEENDAFKNIELLEEFFTKYEYTKIEEENSKEINLLEKKINDYLKENKNILLVNNLNAKNISFVLRKNLNKISKALIIINELNQNGFGYFIGLNSKYIKESNIDINKYIGELNKKIDGKGGGKLNYFQGGSQNKYEENTFNNFLKEISK